MAPLTSLARRALLAGGLALAVSAAPLVAALATERGPAAPAVAQCPPTEVLDPASGACKPVTDRPAPTFNPVDPGINNLQPGAVTSGQPGKVGQLPEVNGIPCNGDNTGLCIGLEQGKNNPGGVSLQPVVPGVAG